MSRKLTLSNEVCNQFISSGFCFSDVSIALVLTSQQPVIFGEAPPSDYPHAHAQCLFVDGLIDYNGPAHIKPSMTTTKIKKSTTSVGKSGMCLEVVPPLPPPSRPFKVVAWLPPCEEAIVLE